MQRASARRIVRLARSTRIALSARSVCRTAWERRRPFRKTRSRLRIPSRKRPQTPKADSAQEKSNAPLILLLLVLLGGGFALYWFKLRKPKPDTKGSADLDDYDFGEEDDEDEPEETVDEDEPV